MSQSLVDLQQLQTDLNLLPAAIAYIERQRSNGPTRRVGGGIKNQCHRKVTQTMEWVVQAESNIESSFVWYFDLHPEGCGYYAVGQ